MCERDEMAIGEVDGRPMVAPTVDDGTIRKVEREFAKAMRDEIARLKRRIAEREAADAMYFADIEVRKGEVMFLEGR